MAQPNQKKNDKALKESKYVFPTRRESEYFTDPMYSGTKGKLRVTSSDKKVCVESSPNSQFECEIFDTLFIIYQVCQKDEIKRKLPTKYPMTNNLLGLYRINVHHITNQIIVESLIELLSDEEHGKEILAALEDPSKHKSKQRRRRSASSNYEKQEEDEEEDDEEERDDFSREDIIRLSSEESERRGHRAQADTGQAPKPGQNRVSEKNFTFAENAETEYMNEPLEEMKYSSSSGSNHSDIDDADNKNNNMRIDDQNEIDPNAFNSNEGQQLDDTDNSFESLEDEDIELFYGSNDSDDNTSKGFRCLQLENISTRDMCLAFRVYDPATGFMNFHKQYVLSGQTQEAIREFNREEKVLKVLSENSSTASPNLIGINISKLELKFEGGNATLFEVHHQLLRMGLQWREEDIIYVLKVLVEHLISLNKLGITHGNIKPQNIVFLPIKQRKYEIRLVNFAGQARNQKHPPKSSSVIPQESTHLFEFPSRELHVSDIDIEIEKHEKFTSPSFQHEEMFAIAKTILYLISSNPQHFFNAHKKRKKGNPIAGLEDLVNELSNKYKYTCPIISKIFKNFEPHNEQFTFYNLEDVHNDLLQTLAAGSNQNQQNAIYCFHDHQNVIQTIQEQRIKESAWNVKMPISDFKQEILYSYSLSEFNRGISLCNYLMGVPNDPQSLYLIKSMNKHNNLTAKSNSQVISLDSPKKAPKITNSNLELQNQTKQKPEYLFKERKLKKTHKKQQYFINEKHEMIIAAQLTCHKIYFSQLEECLPIYFFIKEQLSFFFSRLGYLEESKKVISSLLDELFAQERQETIRVARLERLLGEIYAKQSDFIKAEHCLRNQNSIFQYHSLLNVEAALTLTSLAEVYCQLGNETSAIDSASSACKIIAQILPNSLKLAEINIRCAAVFDTFNHHHHALHSLQEGTEILKHCFQSNPQLSNSLDDPLIRLAASFSYHNQHQQAIQYLEELLQIRENRTQETHPNTPPEQLQLPLAQAHTLLGNENLKLDQIGPALTHFQKALSIRRSHFGEFDTQTAESISDLADAHQKKKEYKEELRLRQQVQKIYLKKAPSSIGAANSHSNLAITYENLHDFKRAQLEHEECISLKSRIFREVSIPVGEAHYRLGNMHLLNKNPINAIKPLEHAKNILLRCGNYSDPLLSETLHSLHKAQMQLNLKVEASNTSNLMYSLQEMDQQPRISTKKRSISKKQNNNISNRSLKSSHLDSHITRPGSNYNSNQQSRSQLDNSNISLFR